MNTDLAVLLPILGACLIGMFWSWQKQLSTEDYLAANRGIPLFVGGLSTGAGWIHAPAFLVSGVLAYQGMWHFVAFWIPNVGALLLQAWLAPKLRAKMRETDGRWYTMAQAMGAIFSPSVRTVMFFATFLALALAVGYTFTGIRQWVEQIRDIPAHTVAMVLAGLSFTFVIFRGLPAAITSDKIKMSVVGIGVVGAMTLYALVETGNIPAAGPELVAHERGLAWYEVLWFVGIPFTASLLGGPMCNPDLPERLLAIQERSVRYAYFQGAAYFALATAAFGLFGVMARHLGITVKAGELPIVTVLQHVLPGWGILIVTIAILIILTMALASLLASAGDVISIEIVRRFFRPQAGDRETILWSQISMVVVILIGTYITSFRSINVAFLQESMAVVRGEAIIPVVFAALFARGAIDTRHVFWGMVAGFVGGFTLFLGWFAMDPVLSKAFPLIAEFGRPIGQLPYIAVHGKVLASLWSLFLPLIGCVLGYCAGCTRVKTVRV